MHLPGLATHALRQAARVLEPGIERHEVERSADPGDAGDDVQPAQAEVQPVDEERNGVHGSRPSLGVRWWSHGGGTPSAVQVRRVRDTAPPAALESAMLSSASGVLWLPNERRNVHMGAPTVGAAPRRGPVSLPSPLWLQDRILYRDGLILIIDKPAGIPVHAGPGGG